MTSQGYFDEHELMHRSLQHYSLILTTNSDSDVISSICDDILGSYSFSDKKIKPKEEKAAAEVKLLEKLDANFQMYGHCSVVSSINPDKIHVYGGFGIPLTAETSDKEVHHGQIQQLTTIDMKKLSYDVTESPSKNVMNSSIVSFVTSQGNEKLVVWGGSSSLGEISRDVITFEQGKWDVIETEGFRPRGRHRHTCDVIENRMWVVGGKIDENVSDEPSIISLDLEKKRWSEELNFNEFPRIHSHSCCVDGERLIVSGGIKSDITISNEFAVWEVDTQEKMCTKHVISGMGARYSHSSHIKKSPKQKFLLVIGGVVLETNPEPDLAIVSMESWTLLRRVKLDQGVPRSPRHFLGHTSHVTTATGDVLVVGGGCNNSIFGLSFTKSPLSVHFDTR